MRSVTILNQLNAFHCKIDAIGVMSEQDHINPLVCSFAEGAK